MKLALVFCRHLHRLGWAGVDAEAAAVAVFSVQRPIGPPRPKGADLGAGPAGGTAEGRVRRPLHSERLSSVVPTLALT